MSRSHDIDLISSLLCVSREFYYIQMEKYARQAIAEGVKNAEDIFVTTDSEIYRVLNLHYNRNNQIEVSFDHFYIDLHFHDLHPIDADP